MALSPKSDLIVEPYSTYPIIQAKTPDMSETLQYIRIELSKLERIVNELADSVPQVADSPPTDPRKGLQRYAVAPWNPGLGSNKWYYWDGAAWVLL